MRILIATSLLILVGGCAVVPPSAWSFDPTQLPAKTPVQQQQFAAMSDRVAQLQTQRTEIRTRIAAEQDVSQRLRDYEGLHRVGMQLSPLERELGRLTPAR